MNQTTFVPSSWPHVTKFIDALNQQFFKLSTPCTFYGANVVQMQTLDVEEIFDNKLATLKVDGERHILFLFVEKNLEVRAFVMCRNGTINDIVIPNFCILHPGTPMKPGYFSIFDAEYYNGHWIVFDCLVYRASKMVCTNMDFTERLKRLQTSFQEDFDSMYIHVKPYYPVNSDLRNLYKSTVDALGFDVQHDGIIFQPTQGVYPLGANMNLTSGRGLKWKDQCTIDLVPERMKLFDIKRLHSQIYGERVLSKTYWNTLIRSNEYYGTCEYQTNVTANIVNGTFEIPKTLCKLRCVSDFSYGINPILTPVTCRLESSNVDVPLCVHLDSSDQNGVKEFLIDESFQPELLRARDDKLVSQANKARTVAGVLWQAKNYQNIYDLIDDPTRIPKRIQHVLPEIISNSNNQISFHDFIRGGYVSFESHNKTFVENEFKIIQTKRPKNSNGIFQSLQEPNYETSSCIDGLHFQRAIDGIIKKYKKADPVEVRTVDFIVDSTLRLTAYEEVIQTKSNKPLVLYKTNGFHGTRKVASGQSYFVQLPEIEKKSGYIYRLDTRTETPEFFCRHEFLTANEEHLNFLKSYETMINSSKRKRMNDLPNNFKGYRFVDSYEFKPEVERNIPLDRIRRSVFDALQIGEVVEVNYFGHGTYHTGKICKINNAGNVDVEYAYNVRATNFHYKSGYIPVVIDAKKGCMLRFKRRKTFEFEGFKIDFTRTKNIVDFKPTEKRRLHHMMNRCDSYEVEIELNPQIKIQTAFIEKLREVMMSLYEFMGLDENSFLFDHVVIPSVPSDLSNVLNDYSRYIGYTDDLYGIHQVFLKTLQGGVSRVVRESDFHAMFDEEMDLLLPRIENNEFTPEEMSIDLPLERLSEYVEVNDVIINDYIARRIFKTLQKSSNGEYVLRQLGTELFANNICWTNPDETFKLLCKQLGVESLQEIEDEDFLQQLRSLLFGVTADSTELNTFFIAPFEFAKVLYEYYCRSMDHAWYDESEVSYVWNDILYFAKRFSNMLYQSEKLTELFGNSVLSYHVHRDTAKLAVIVGFIQQCRMHSQSNDIIENVNLMSLTLEYSKYTPRHLFKQIDVVALKNVVPVLLL
jgi:hypothetical protein